MDPSEFVAEELDAWQRALRGQDQAERDAEDARRAGDPAKFADALNRVEKLRIKADLLLAEAVSLKCSYRDSRWARLNQFL